MYAWKASAGPQDQPRGYNMTSAWFEQHNDPCHVVHMVRLSGNAACLRHNFQATPVYLHCGRGSFARSLMGVLILEVASGCRKAGSRNLYA